MPRMGDKRVEFTSGARFSSLSSTTSTSSAMQIVRARLTAVLQSPSFPASNWYMPSRGPTDKQQHSLSISAMTGHASRL